MSKYCQNCNITFNNPEFKYCPNCANELIDENYLMALNHVKKLSKEYIINVCENCDESFPLNFNFCPFCASELKNKEKFMINEQEGIITAKWNNSIATESIMEVYFSLIANNSDSFYYPTIFDIVEKYKDVFDKKLENSFKDTKYRIPKKLTYNQLKKIIYKTNNCILSEDRFMNSDMMFEENIESVPELNIIKIRKDLFYIYDIDEYIQLD